MKTIYRRILATFLTVALGAFTVVAAEPSSRPGMGPIIYNGGVAFRVWAPNATAVSVAGQFNNWSQTANPLFPEPGGHWSADVPAARVGHEYKYVIQHDGNTHWRTDPRSTQVTNSVGNSVVADLGHQWQANYTAPPWNETVIYEMHIGGFNDSPGGGPGTFNSAIQKLDHLQDLAISTVQLMPIHEFAGDFSWGYNPAHPYTVESAYGRPRDFQRFVDEAHKRGIGVYIDVVHNHYGPTDLGMWNFDGPSFGNGGIYFYTDWRRQTPWGDTRPDFGRPEVRDFIKDQVLFFLNEYRLDGMRWDSTSNIWSQNESYGAVLPDGELLLRTINGEVDTTQPWKPMIAEDFHRSDDLTQTGGSGLGFDSRWNGLFKDNIRPALTNSSDAGRDMNSVAAAIGQVTNGQLTQRVIFTENHDEVANGRARVTHEIDPQNPASWYARKRSTLGGVLVMTSPGIPMIFQGQELLEDGWWDVNDPNTWIMDWNRGAQFSGITTLYRDLIRLRRNWYDNTRGLRGNHTNIFHVNNGAKVIAWHRYDQGGEGDDVVIIVNMSNTKFDEYRIGFPRAGTWHTVFNSDSTTYSADYQNFGPAAITTTTGSYDGLAQNAAFPLQAYSALIFSQKQTPSPVDPAPTGWTLR